MKKICILVVDDHEIIHRGLKDLLQSEPDYLIQGHAYNGKEAIEKATLLNPDVVFMDISMPVLNGIDAIKAIHAELPATKIIVLTQHDESEFIVQALKAGAHGYLMKNSSKEQFLAAVEHVRSDKRFLDAEATSKIIDNTLRSSDKNSEVNEIYLTRREKEIIQKIADEKSNQQIADELSISLRTVETHRRNIMQKLKVSTVVGLLKYAANYGIVSLK